MGPYIPKPSLFPTASENLWICCGGVPASYISSTSLAPGADHCFNTNSNTNPHCTADTCAHIKCSTYISLPLIGSHLSYAGNKNWEKHYNGLDSKDEVLIGKHLERINSLTATPIWGEVFRDAPGGGWENNGKRKEVVKAVVMPPMRKGFGDALVSEGVMKA